MSIILSLVIINQSEYSLNLTAVKVIPLCIFTPLTTSNSTNYSANKIKNILKNEKKKND